MLTVHSKINKQIVKDLKLEGFKVSKETAERILDLINSDREITNKIIRQIAFTDFSQLIYVDCDFYGLRPLPVVPYPDFLDNTTFL